MTQNGDILINLPMNLDKCLFVIIFLMYFTIVCCDSDIMVLKKGLDEVSLHSSGLIFFVDVNNTSDKNINVELLPVRCCLRKGLNEDCEVLEVIGESVGKIPKGTVMTLTAVAPLMDPYDRVGNCVFHLVSKPHNRNRRATKNLKIKFNTQIKNEKQFTSLPNNIKVCDGVDEDPLNDCNPVDCETYYNSKRSYFNRKLRKCTKIPVCLQNSAGDPILYDPTSNKCLVNDFITNDDIKFIKDLTRQGSNPSNEVIVIKSTYKPLKQNNVIDTIKPNDNIKDGIKSPYLNLTEEPIKIIKPKPKICIKTIINKITTKKCTLTILVVVIVVQCCLICTMILFVLKHCKCCKKKKVTNKFFSKGHDVSITTPLICTSNIDTETAFNYTGESSNVDQKIKCYKACQKERKNMKMSLSDDILSKCLTRRDWNWKPTRFDATQQKLLPHTEEPMMPQHLKKGTEESNTPDRNNQDQFDDRKKSSDLKVNFENEVLSTLHDKKDKTHTKVVKNMIKKLEKNNKEESKDSQCDLSETEIKCHSYNFINVNSLNDGNQSSYNKNYNVLQIDTNKPKSISTEKSAQASFSNDSIDDFFSERGIILANENISKYSYSSLSDPKKTPSSSASSKTSKNNRARTIFSFLRRSKRGPSSETAVEKSTENLNLELIHMSRASINSSSNEYEYLQKFRKPRDSRTSL